MPKIVINADYGGFGLSNEAIRLYLTKSGQPWEEETREPSGLTYFWLNKANEELFWENDLNRNDPILVEIVENLTSEKASARFAKLKVIEIPDDVDWYIEEYDGREWISERHRTWR